jgi:hypothetical protein
MKNTVNGFHRKTLFDLYYEKVDAFFISLQKIYWIVTLTNKNFTVFRWEKFSKLSVINCWSSKFKGCVKQRNILWKN